MAIELISMEVTPIAINQRVTDEQMIIDAYIDCSTPELISTLLNKIHYHIFNEASVIAKILHERQG